MPNIVAEGRATLREGFVQEAVRLAGIHCQSMDDWYYAERCMAGAPDPDTEGEEDLSWYHIDWLGDWLEEIEHGEHEFSWQEQEEIKGAVKDICGDWREAFAGDGWD